MVNKTPKKALTEAEKKKREDDKAKAFVALANKRVGKVLAANTVLKRLANTRNYKFTDDQLANIDRALTESVASTIKAFRDALKGGTAATVASSFDVNK